MYAALVAARDALAALADVSTCSIGLEPDISPADYPLIRIVPNRAVPGVPYGKRTIEATIYFGMDTTASQGTELVYERLGDMETAIIGVVRALEGRYIETLFASPDEEIQPYKVMAVRCELRAANVAPG